MPPAPQRVVTLKDVAERARVSLATVSYALRRHPKIPVATRDRVATAARELGYRPNPRVASLMAHIRGAHARPPAERLAFVWVHTSRADARQNPFFKSVFAGARDRASQMGFVLEEFWTDAPGMTDLRLEQILRARGIVGVLLSPVTTAEASVTLDWDWRHFSPAVIGNATWSPELHHAGHHHFLGMRLALVELAKLGCTRPAALVHRQTNERAKRAWEAAFLTHHPDPAAARSLLRLQDEAACPTTSAWLADNGADAMIVSELELLRPDDLPTTQRAPHRPIVTLHWRPDTPRGIGGIDQYYDQVAAQAVDLVAAQLNANETSPPALPRTLLFPGRWVAPRVPGRRRAAAGH